MKHNIIVNELLGQSCMTMTDGQRLYDKIYPLINNNEVVVLDFDGISSLTSVFLNYAIGQLYVTIDSALVDKLLYIKNAAKDDMELINRVINNSIAYKYNLFQERNVS